MSQKAFSKIWILVIVAALLVFAGVLVYQQMQAPEREVAPADETADWKLYRNEDWSFEAKYPSGLTPEVKVDIPADNLFNVQFGESLGLSIFDIGMEGNIRMYTIKGSEDEIIIDGVKGLQFRITDQSGRKEYIQHIIVKNNNNLYSFGGNEELLDEFISTFRFLE